MKHSQSESETIGVIVLGVFGIVEYRRSLIEAMDIFVQCHSLTDLFHIILTVDNFTLFGMIIWLVIIIYVATRNFLQLFSWFNSVITKDKL
jgi:hypothetical protein